MLTKIASFVRNRWHPLWRLRKLSSYRRFQKRFDRTVYTRIPGTGLQVAVKLLRDARWIVSPNSLEPEMRAAFALVMDVLKPSVFWDIGSNIGIFSWLVRAHPAMRQIVMFEPDPTNHSLISRTIQRNSISNCRALNIALSDRCGETTFLVDHASGTTGSLEATSTRDNDHSLHHAYQMAQTVKCQTATVDSLIDEGLPPPSLMKIDVEGAEHLVLAGATSCLRRDFPALIVETVNQEAIRNLRSTGYRAFRIDAGDLLFVSATRTTECERISTVFPEYTC